MAAAASSPALTRWTELNDRQQGTLAVIYELDQEIEADRRRAAASGYYDRAPAAKWRAIDFAHDPGLRELFGWTLMQSRLEQRGWDNQGNGSTMAALADRGLILRGSRQLDLGMMLTVRLTREGRAAARAGTSTAGGRAAKAVMSGRAWEVLALLWAADTRGQALEWGYSATIERVLIGRHDPPLAEQLIGSRGYRITARGREFYRDRYQVQAAAHPEVRAPHPGGDEPWPPRADEVLRQHANLYGALCTEWQRACADEAAASAEATAASRKLPGCLPPAVLELAAARNGLWEDTARQRAELAAGQSAELSGRCGRAARAYAVAALAAFAAAAAGSRPLDVLQEPDPGGHDTWDEPRLAPPAGTGIYAIDAEARKLHAAAAGTPLRRRGPAPRRRARVATIAPRPPFPGRDLADLAAYLQAQVEGGDLLRKLHPELLSCAALAQG